MSDEAITEIAIAVLQAQDQFLIGKREAGGPLANYWEFPGGKIRPDESPAEAVARECREETGLDVRVGDLMAEIEHTYPHGRLRLHFFACAPIDTSVASHPRFRWVPRSELARYEFPEANREVIARLLGDC